ncbi:MAG: type VI secretion system-associated protein TagF [Nitrospirae bacterium]|nr:type VI secretion system-associated protein TagF [Nitrospirota bacterium]
MDYFSLGCFGKLPIHADFIRYNADGMEVRGLDQWFQEGIQFAKSKLGPGWEEEFSKADVWRFVFQVDGSDRFLVGIFAPSRDQGGRRYPFILFLRVDRTRFPGPIYFAPLLFSTFWNRATEAAQTGWKGTELKGFLSAIERLTVPIEKEFELVREAYLGHLQEQTVGDFWTKLLGDFSHPRKYLMDRNLLDILLPMRHNPLNKFGLGLKFPLSLQGAGEGYDIPFWFDMTFRLLKQNKVDPVFFWNRGPTKGMPCMMAFFRRPSAKNFLFLVRPDLDGDSWYDLAPEESGNPENVIGGIGKERRDMLDQGGLSLAAFLEATEALE